MSATKLTDYQARQAYISFRLVIVGHLDRIRVLLGENESLKRSLAATREGRACLWPKTGDNHLRDGEDFP